MNLSQMMDFVRAQADTDINDAPDAVLEVYARAAYQHIQSLVWPWPQNKTFGTLSTIASQSGYNLSDVIGAPDMIFVSSVAAGNDVLEYVSPEVFRYLDSEGSTNGTPSRYTVDGSVIKLWPNPTSDGLVLDVTGFRSFADWPDGSAEPDLPRGFDVPICWYMLSKYYMAQEDLELAERYLQVFTADVNTQIAAALRSSSITAGPMIFGGSASPGLSYQDWVKRNVEG